MESVIRFLKKNMILEVFALMIVSIFLGRDHHSFFVGLKRFLPLALFLMLYKPMTYLKLDEALTGATAVKKKYLAALTLLYCIVFPASAYLLMKALLWILPGIESGLIAGVVLLALSPVASSTPAFVEMAGGDVQLTLVGVIYTFLLSLFVIPLGSRLILSRVVTVSLLSLLKSLVVCIGIPLVIGQFTRYLIVKYRGKEALKKLKTPLDALVLAGLFAMVFTVFGINGKVIAEQPHTIFYGLVLMNIYFLLRWFLTFATGKLLRLPAEQNIALTYSSTYNMTIATAVGIATFGPMAAVGTVIGGPFAEMIQMILLVEFFKHFR